MGSDPRDDAGIVSEWLSDSLPPEHPRLELHAWHAPADADHLVGGDWYDVFETEGSLWLVMGDAAGHGVAAAAQAGQLRHSLRAYADEGYGLVGTLEHLNALLVTRDPVETATVCIAAVSPDGDTVRVVRAGHPPPLLVPAVGPARLVDGHTGVVLGMRGARFESSTMSLTTGDRLVLYTDGLVERRDEPIDRGLERLRASAEGVEGTSALRAHLVAALTSVDSLRDDVALLIAQR